MKTSRSYLSRAVNARRNRAVNEIVRVFVLLARPTKRCATFCRGVSDTPASNLRRCAARGGIAVVRSYCASLVFGLVIENSRVPVVFLRQGKLNFLLRFGELMRELSRFRDICEKFLMLPKERESFRNVLQRLLLELENSRCSHRAVDRNIGETFLEYVETLRVRFLQLWERNEFTDTLQSSH